MNWFREHRLLTVISGIILALCLVIVVSFLSVGGSSFLGNKTHSIVHVIQHPLSFITGGVKNTVAGIFKYDEVKNENEQLKEKLRKAEETNKDLLLTKDELRQLKDLSRSLSFDPYKNRKQAVAARITEIDNSNPYIVFTVDAGTEDGVSKDDIVVDGKGLIGKVLDTGKHWSKVVSVLSETNNISFKSLRKTSVMGVLAGDGKKILKGYVMKKEAPIIKGDILVTSGIGVYPEGIKIGKVSSVDYDEDRQLKVVEVQPTVEFETLQKVTIYK